MLEIKEFSEKVHGKFLSVTKISRNLIHYILDASLKVLSRRVSFRLSDDKYAAFYLGRKISCVVTTVFFVHRYAYLSRRCISKDECQNMNHIRRFSKLEEVQTWRPFNNSCVTQCPDGFEDYVDDKNV